MDILIVYKFCYQMFEIFCARKVKDECLNSSVLVFFNGFYSVWKAELKVCMRDRPFVIQEILCSRICTNLETSSTEVLHCVNSYWLKEGHWFDSVNKQTDSCCLLLNESPVDFTWSRAAARVAILSQNGSLALTACDRLQLKMNSFRKE